MALTNKLEAIADAIRTKTGSVELLTLEEMPVAIISIETGSGNSGLLNSIIDRTITTLTAADLSGINKIGNYAFYGTDGLISVTIPGNVKRIGENAFKSCLNLSNLILEDGIQTIDPEAFKYCTSLKSVVIPDSLSVIQTGVFDTCSALTSVTFGANIIGIGMDAFDGCTSLTDVYYKGTEEQWNAISIGLNNTALTNATIHYNYVG